MAAKCFRLIEGGILSLGYGAAIALRPHGPASRSVLPSQRLRNRGTFDWSPPARDSHRVSAPAPGGRERPSRRVARRSDRHGARVLRGRHHRPSARRLRPADSRPARTGLVTVDVVAVDRRTARRHLHRRSRGARPAPRRSHARRGDGWWPDGGVAAVRSLRVDRVRRAPDQRGAARRRRARRSRLDVDPAVRVGSKLLKSEV